MFVLGRSELRVPAIPIIRQNRCFQLRLQRKFGRGSLVNVVSDVSSFRIEQGCHQQERKCGRSAGSPAEANSNSHLCSGKARRGIGGRGGGCCEGLGCQGMADYFAQNLIRDSTGQTLDDRNLLLVDNL
eukprot:750006-Hanusia_phi.AAC.1